VYDSLTPEEYRFLQMPGPHFSRLLLCLTLGSLALLWACGGESESADDSAIPSPAFDHSSRPWKIVVSLPIFADFVRIAGGDQVEITTLIPPGEDPHTYEPPEEMADAVREADIVFVNGLGLDDPTIGFINTHPPDGRLFLIDFVRNVPSPTTPQPVDRPVYAKEAGDDPHLFLDPTLVPVYVETVAHSLTIIDGGNQPYYDARYLQYKAELEELHAEIAEQMTSVPANNRGLIVSDHASLIHFANRYGLEIAATVAEDGSEGVQTTVEQRSVPAVFREAGIDDETLDEVAEATGADICRLFTDTIDDAEMTYLEMMRHDADEIAGCLGG
jgi:ABC-type Zn uptake system ZnuABC Zn-binding protein ZnuA